MKLILFIALIFIPSWLCAEGPLFRHKEPEKQQEFENVYQDLRSSPNKFIQNTTYYQTDAQFNVATGTVKTRLQVGSGNGSTASPLLCLGTGGACFYTDSAGNINLVDSGYVYGALTSTQFLASSGTTASPGLSFNFDADTGINIAAANHLEFVTNGTRRVEIITSSMTSNIAFRNTGQPDFSAYLGSSLSNFVGSNVTARTIPFDTELYDQDNGMGTSTYTVTTAGKYSFDATAIYNCATSHDSGEATITIVTTNANFRDVCTIGSVSVGANFSCSVHGSGNMSNGDIAYVTLQVYGVGGAGSKDCQLTGISGSTLLTRFSGRMTN